MQRRALDERQRSHRIQSVRHQRVTGERQLELRSIRSRAQHNGRDRQSQFVNHHLPPAHGLITMLVVHRIEQGLNGQILLRYLQLLQQLLRTQNGRTAGMNVGDQLPGGMHEGFPELPKRLNVQRFARRALHCFLGVRNLPNLVSNAVKKPRGRQPARILGTGKRIVLQHDHPPRGVLNPPGLQIDVCSRPVADAKPAAIPMRGMLRPEP